MTINTVIRIKKKASPLQYGVIAVVNAIADPSHKLEWVDACEGNVAVYVNTSINIIF